MRRAARDNPLEERPPTPPLALADRVGKVSGAADRDEALAQYEELGRLIRRDLSDLLPSDWSFEGKRVLDFGCGAGRVLRHFLAEAQTAEFYGCDIDAESIDWLERHLSPPVHVFTNQETPPLHQPDRHFDLIFAISVFTHVTDEWSAWLLELHRLLKDDGLLFATFHGPGAVWVAQGPWQEERIGMNVLQAGQGWDLGGPIVFHSPWWIAEHWGRAFEIVSLREAGLASPNDSSLGQGTVLLRKKLVSPTREELERIRPDEPREIAALRHNIDQLQAEAQTLREGLGRLQAEARNSRDLGALARMYETSLNWRITRPLRVARAVLRTLEGAGSRLLRRLRERRP